ncbi:hypothetical protein CsatA_011749 [Cannabis sativa]
MLGNPQEFLHSKDSSNYFYLWSSFENLLLVESSQHTYICNPFTKQCISLPQSPNAFHKYYRYALVVSRDYDDTNISNKLEYKVVKISTNVFNKVRISPVRFDLHITIFSSKTRQWTSSTNFKFPVFFHLWNHQGGVVGSNNGIVYWTLGSFFHIEAIALFNIITKEWLVIGIPLALHCGCVVRCSCKEFKVYVGVVGGKVVLAFLKNYAFMAWEIYNEDGNNKMFKWNSVHYHDLMMMRRFESIDLLAVHPDDKDIFFFSDHSNKIYQCQILGQNKCDIENICHLPLKDCPRMRVVTLLHP